MKLDDVKKLAKEVMEENSDATAKIKNGERGLINELSKLVVVKSSGRTNMKIAYIAISELIRKNEA